jgi:DNA ligase (NAD+)
MDIEGLGERMVEQLVERGRVNSLADIYRLDAGALAGLERMGDKSSANLIAAIDRSRAAPLARFLFGLGIRHVGEEVARQLATEFGGIGALASADWVALQADKAEIQKRNARARSRGEPLEPVPLEGIGPEITDSLNRFFGEPGNREGLAALAGVGVAAADPATRAPAAAPDARGRGRPDH